MANLCRSMLRVAAEFFEYEERHNVRQRMIEMKNAIIEHKEAILEHEETIRAESKKNENTQCRRYQVPRMTFMVGNKHILGLMRTNGLSHRRK